MSLRIVQLVSLLSCVVLLSSCNHLWKKQRLIRDYSDDYQISTRIPPLKVPPPLSSKYVGSSYTIPNESAVGTGAVPPSLLPPDSLAERLAAQKKQ